MTKFFLPLILLTLIAWIIVGVQQEYGDLNFDVNQDSVSINIQPNYSDSLSLDKYYGFQLYSEGNLNFLLPSSMIATTELTNESDAHRQFYRNYPPLNFVLYKDSFSTDPNSYNYSLDNYVAAAINVSRKKSLFFKMDDSLVFNLSTGEKAILVSFKRAKMLDDASVNTRSIAFLATSDEENLYMLYFYCDTTDYNSNLQDIYKVFTSASIIKY